MARRDCIIVAIFYVLQSTMAEWLPFNDHEFYIQADELVTNSEAVKRCSEMQSILSPVETIGVHDFLKNSANNLSGSTELWIGLFDVELNDQRYLWADGGNFTEEQSRWDSEIPDQTFFHCIHTVSDMLLWTSDVCHAKHGYICKRKLELSKWIIFEKWEFLVNEDVDLNFDNSSEQCSTIGGHLVVFTNPDVKMFVAGKIPPDKLFWIGLKDERVWSDGLVLSITDGIPGVIPLDSCFAFDSMLNFHMSSCQSTRSFVCQRETPDSWFEWNDTEYLVKAWPEFTQQEAVSECSDKMSQLVSVSSNEEHLFLRGLTAQTAYFTHAWIGLKNYGSMEGPLFYWQDFSSLGNKTWWGLLEPSTNGRCVVSSDYCMLWDVEDCNMHSGYICKRKKDVDDCVTAPCMNRGICADGLFDYSCLCTPGYTGKDCSVELTPGGVDLLSDGLALSCNLYHVTALLSKAYIDGLNVGDVTSLQMLNSEGFKIKGCESNFNETANQHEFNFEESFGQCSAMQEEVDSYIVVSYIASPVARDMITSNKVLLFDCTYKAPNNSQIRTTEYFIGSQERHLPYLISRYESSMFSVKKNTNEITEGARVYVGITLNINENNPLVLQGLSCWVTDNLDLNFYHILNDGCEVDDPLLASGSNVVYESHVSRHVRFSFIPFLWNQASDPSLYVSCSVIACLPEAGKSCNKNCLKARKKRSTNKYKDINEILSLGPLLFTKQSSCPVDNPCSHVCVTGTIGEVLCGCPPGMSLLGDKLTCIDLSAVNGKNFLQTSPIYAILCLFVVILSFLSVVVCSLFKTNFYCHIKSLF